MSCESVQDEEQDGAECEIDVHGRLSHEFVPVSFARSILGRSLDGSYE